MTLKNKGLSNQRNIWKLYDCTRTIKLLVILWGTVCSCTHPHFSKHHFLFVVCPTCHLLAFEVVRSWRVPEKKSRSNCKGLNVPFLCRRISKNIGFNTHITHHINILCTVVYLYICVYVMYFFIVVWCIPKTIAFHLNLLK
jgi:hypothetical protein